MIRHYLTSRAVLLSGMLTNLAMIILLGLLDVRIGMSPATIGYLPILTLFLTVCFTAWDIVRWLATWQTARKLVERPPETAGFAIPDDVMSSTDRGEAALACTIARGVADTAKRRITAMEEERRGENDYFSSFIHELKTPVSVMRLLIQTGQGFSEKTGHRLTAELDRIESNLERALYFLRSSSFSRDYHITSVSIERLVAERLARLEPAIASRELTVDLSDTWYEVDSDAKWLGFILGQLLENASKYTSVGGTIGVSMHRSDTATAVVVSSSGPGIPSTDAPRIFDRGYTGEAGRTGEGSSGLGLYLASSLSSRLGHRLSLDPGSETRPAFRIEFPRWSDHFV